MESEYVPPALEDLGSLHEVTLATGLGLIVDADWSVGGKKKSNVTFS